MEKNFVIKSLKGVLFGSVLSVGLLGFTQNAYADEEAIKESLVVASTANLESEVKVAKVDEEKVEENKNVISPVITRAEPVIDENGKHDSLLSLNLGGTLLGGILGEVEVGVLDYKQNSDGTIETSGLVSVNVKDSALLGNIHLGVVDSEKRQTEDESYTSTGLVKANIDNQLLGKIDAGVLESTKAFTKDYEYTYNGVLNVNLKDTILGDAHVGVIEEEIVETDDYVWKHSGLILVNTKNNPILGDLNLGVAENEEFIRKDSTPIVKPEDEKPGNKDEDPIAGNDPKPENPVGAEDPTKPEAPQTPGETNNNDTQNPGKSESPGKSNNEKPAAEQETLPVTGSVLDSSILLMISVLLMGVGVTLRKRFNVSE